MGFSIKVPGRICFFGDHQDYLGLPVIAGTIDRFLYIEAEAIQDHYFKMTLLDTSEQIRIPLDTPTVDTPPHNYFESGLTFLRQKGAVFTQGYSLRIKSDIPINAGLSSSSALVVGWLRFLLNVQQNIPQPSNAVLGHWAYEVEVLAFKQPGGLMDQYTIAQGGLLYIDTDSQQSHPLPLPSCHWVVAESGVEKKTLTVLKNAREWQQKALQAVVAKEPQFQLQQSTTADYSRFLQAIPDSLHAHWYASIYNYDITQKAHQEFLREADPNTLGTLINAHQHILSNHIQNTPKALVHMLDSANDAGALGSKIIGSGGGGCMVSLVTESNQERVIDAYMKAGAKKAYRITLTAGHE